MNIISKLTLRHLEGNKKRTIVTILGIAMSTALISAMLLGVFSFFKFMGKISILSDGNIHAAFSEVTEDQVQALKGDDRIDIVGITNTDPKISGVRLDSGKADRFRIGNIECGDENFWKQKVVSEYEGTLPTNSSEIAVEENYLKDNGFNMHVGDKLTFEQGCRYVNNVSDVEYIGGNYRDGELFDTQAEQTCIITAILHGNRPTNGYDILRGMDDGTFPVQKYAQAGISLKKCDATALLQIKSIIKETGITKYELNSEYLLSVFAYLGSGGTYLSFFIVMGIALAIVMVTSVILIVNSIGMSLTERIRYLGMLSSVGATGRQKRFSIYFEGFILGFIGIPLGILFGYIGTKVTLFFLGSRILEADMLAGAEGMRGSIPIACSPWVIFAIIFFSGLTIFISTLFPALKAAKIMPVDALRQSNTIKVKAGALRVNPLIHLFFGYEGELAYKNIKRNGVKGFVITASIAVSVVMFLTINYLCDSMERVNQYDLDYPCQVVATCVHTERDRLRNEILKMKDVENAFGVTTIQFNFVKGGKEDEYLANTDIANPAFLNKKYEKFKVDGMLLALVDDEDFKSLLAENGLSEERYFGDTLRGVLVNNITHDEKAGEVFNSGIIGQSLHYDEEYGNPPAVEISDFVRYDKDNYIFNLTPKGCVTVVAPVSVYFRKGSKVIPEELLTYDLGVVTEKHEEVFTKTSEMLENEGFHSFTCTDTEASLGLMNVITLMIKTVMYGFTVLLTLITVANIVNTISTGVLLRRKEFAMYKSVGMTSSGFRKMIRLETLLYGIRALVFSIPVSLMLNYLMYSKLDDKLFEFRPDLISYIAVIAAVFAVVGVSMLLSINKIKDDSIIEALKYDMV